MSAAWVLSGGSEGEFVPCLSPSFWRLLATLGVGWLVGVSFQSVLVFTWLSSSDNKEVRWRVGGTAGSITSNNLRSVSSQGLLGGVVLKDFDMHVSSSVSNGTHFMGFLQKGSICQALSPMPGTK